MKSIIHIGGLDTYDQTHESGNTILFDIIKKLPFNSTHVLGLQRLKNDPQSVFIPLGGGQKGLENYISPDAVILYDSLLKPQTVLDIYEKHKCPIIWSAMGHDFLTGGCAYPNQHGLSCEKFKTDCSECPQRVNNSPETLKDKIRLNEIELYGVAASTYSLSLMNSSPIFKDKKCVLIPFPYDEIPVSDLSKEEAREMFSIPQDKFVIFWGTCHPDTPRKGKVYAEEALNNLYKKVSNPEDFVLVTAGLEPTVSFKNTQPFELIHAGYMDTREKLSHLYKAADVGLQSTVEDAGPMMVTECLMNNTRVVSFDNCVSPDVIEEGKTGFVVPTFDTEALGEALLKAYATKDLVIDCTKKCLEFNSKESFKKKWFDFLSEVMK
jgi:glycosyltransferase involved in cell wall biosynthesis